MHLIKGRSKTPLTQANLTISLSASHKLILIINTNWDFIFLNPSNYVCVYVCAREWERGIERETDGRIARKIKQKEVGCLGLVCSLVCDLQRKAVWVREVRVRAWISRNVTLFSLFLWKKQSWLERFSATFKALLLRKNAMQVNARDILLMVYMWCLQFVSILGHLYIQRQSCNIVTAELEVVNSLHILWMSVLRVLVFQ